LKYYTFAYEQFPAFGQMIQPPFRVLDRVPGINALLEFDGGALPLLQRIFAENDSMCWVCDKKRRRYKISKAGIELRKPRARPGFDARCRRDMRRAKRWQKADEQLCGGVTEPVTLPNGRTPLFFRNRRYIYIRPDRQHPFRYTLRSPKQAGKDYPLVVYLHGAGAGGTNGLKPLFHFLLTIPRVRQKYHLLVPQEGLFDIYGDEFSDALGETIDNIPRVDRSRIYITGMSMGGCGAIIECRRHPERYAAAVPTVPWLFNLRAGGKTRNAMAPPLDAKGYDALAKTPMWLTYSPLERRLNEQLCEALLARNANLRQTYIRLHGFFGHIATPFIFSMIKPWSKWLFAQRKERA